MISFSVAITRWIRRAFMFGGRASRSEYWWPFLLSLAVSLGCLVIFATGGGLSWLEALMAWSEAADPDAPPDLPELSGPALFGLVFLVVFSLLTFIPNLSLSFRRFHDMGQPGWLHLVFMGAGLFIAGIGLLELVWLAFLGQSGPNRYGPDPLGTPQADEF